MDNGSYVQYFQPHAGLPIFRRFYGERSPFNALRKSVAKSIEYYDAELGESRRLKDVRVKRRMVNGHPVFRVNSKEKDMDLSLEMSTYTRACWKFRQPLLGPLATVLYYNEYPAKLTDFSFEQGDHKVNFEDVGGGIGNCEHSWGLLF